MFCVWSCIATFSELLLEDFGDAILNFLASVDGQQGRCEALSDAERFASERPSFHRQGSMRWHELRFEERLQSAISDSIFEEAER